MCPGKPVSFPGFFFGWLNCVLYGIVSQCFSCVSHQGGFGECACLSVYVCLRCTVVDSSMALFIGFLFLRIPTITCLHTGQMYLTRECPKPFFQIYLSPTPFLSKTSWKHLEAHTHGPKDGTSGYKRCLWVGPYALSFGSIWIYALSGVVLYMHSQQDQQGLPDAEAARESRLS